MGRLHGPVSRAPSVRHANCPSLLVFGKRAARLTLVAKFRKVGQEMMSGRRSARLLRLLSCLPAVSGNDLLGEACGWGASALGIDGEASVYSSWNSTARWCAGGDGFFQGKCMRRSLSDNASHYRGDEIGEGFMDANLALLETWGFDKVDQAKVCYGVNEGLDKIDTREVEQKLKWLTQELEFAARDVSAIVQRHPAYLSASLTEVIAPFLQLFLIEAKHKKDVVRKIVARHPPILTSAAKFEASFEVVREHLGLGRLEWLKAVSKSPSVMKLEVGGMGAAIQGLLANGFTKEDVMEIVCVHPFVLGHTQEEKIKVELANIIGLGLDANEVSRVVKLVPQILDVNTYRKIRSKIKYLVEHLGFAQAEALAMFVRHPKVFFVGLECWKRNCDLLGSFGLSTESVAQCVKTSPYFMAWDAPSIKEKYAFAVDTLKKSKEDIVAFPDYFRYSLESRIMMRAAMYDAVGRDYTKPSLHSLLAPGKSSFNRKFGKKYPPSTMEWFEAKWVRLTKDQKLLALKNKSYWDLQAASPAVSIV